MEKTYVAVVQMADGSYTGFPLRNHTLEEIESAFEQNRPFRGTSKDGEVTHILPTHSVAYCELMELDEKEDD